MFATILRRIAIALMLLLMALWITSPAVSNGEAAHALMPVTEQWENSPWKQGEGAV